MTLQQISYVITIAEKGSYSKASEALYIAQPSLTSAIKELERELGITIFIRGRQGVTLTSDGTEFLAYANQIYRQYEAMLDKYGKREVSKKRIAVSTQHYSFAVKSFVEMVRNFSMDKYEFAIRETSTMQVIDDVSLAKSEVGVLYVSDFNRSVITRLLRANNLDFYKLIECKTSVYLWKNHPLAGCSSIRLEQLMEYPCLSFEQPDTESLYLSEEIFITNNYPRMIKVTDRASMLNLMVGLNGYTLCSGIICEELNGNNYIAIPIDTENGNESNVMEIGYVIKKGMMLSDIGKFYIDEMRKYLQSVCL